MNFKKLKEDIVSKLVLLAILSSPGWIGYSVMTVLAVGQNTEAIEANASALTELAEAVGGMVQLHGNAGILENGNRLTAAINTSSPATRFDQGQRLQVTNKSDQSRAIITVVIEGSFESDPYHLLDLSAAAGRALRASEEKIQVAIEPVQEKKAD